MSQPEITEKMSGVSLPVTRPQGRALIVGNSAFRAEPARLLAQQGYDCSEAPDAYAAMLSISRDRLGYQALIICVASFFPEELHLIAAVKRRMPHVEIWLTQIDGRMALLAESMRLGADGLLAEDGLHRFSTTPAPVVARSSDVESSASDDESMHDSTDDNEITEPVLSADELRALLQDQPSMPPSGNE